MLQPRSDGAGTSEPSAHSGSPDPSPGHGRRPRCRAHRWQRGSPATTNCPCCDAGRARTTSTQTLVPGRGSPIATPWNDQHPTLAGQPVVPLMVATLCSANRCSSGGRSKRPSPATILPANTELTTVTSTSQQLISNRPEAGLLRARPDSRPTPCAASASRAGLRSHGERSSG